MENDEELKEEYKRLELEMAESRIREKEERIKRENEKREAALLAKEKKHEKMLEKRAKIEEDPQIKKVKLDKTPHKQEKQDHKFVASPVHMPEFSTEKCLEVLIPEITPVKKEASLTTVNSEITPKKYDASDHTEMDVEVKAEAVPDEKEEKNEDVNMKSDNVIGTCVPDVDLKDPVLRGEVTPKKDTDKSTVHHTDSAEIMRFKKQTEIKELLEHKGQLSKSGDADSVLKQEVEQKDVDDLESKVVETPTEKGEESKKVPDENTDIIKENKPMAAIISESLQVSEEDKVSEDTRDANDTHCEGSESTHVVQENPVVEDSVKDSVKDDSKTGSDLSETQQCAEGGGTVNETGGSEKETADLEKEAIMLESEDKIVLESEDKNVQSNPEPMDTE